MGRPKSGYDWEGKKDMLYDLYITQNKSMDEVLALQPDAKTIPSKRAFQKRFKEWGFPSKHLPAPNDAALFDRVRQLWEINTSHKQMAVILNAEGFDVNERQLAKIRQKNGLWIRENRKQVVAEGAQEEEGNDGLENPSGPVEQKRQRSQEEGDDSVPAEVIAKRRERHAKLMEESEDRLKSRTRRRRTKGWAGLPPDEGLGPRFPSELTLAEAVVDLGLDKSQYKDVRSAFEEICQTSNLVKKTICGPERWAEAKQVLISRFPELQSIFWGPDTTFLNQTRKPMALDVVCMDVTKRLRTAGNYMTIADAKNILGLTPQEARDARNAFDGILRADFFTGKLESTKEHWEELKSRWVKGSTRLRMAMAVGEADPAHESKVRAVEAIARDVQKRNRDNQTRHVFPKQSPSSGRQKPNPGPRLATARSLKSGRTSNRTTSTTPTQGAKYQNARKAGADLLEQVNNAFESDNNAPDLSNPIATLASQALASAPSYPNGNHKDYSGMQIDPSLLEAASLPTNNLPHASHSNDESDDLFSQLHQHATFLSSPLAQTQKAVYFRLSPPSAQLFPSAPKIWLDTLMLPLATGLNSNEDFDTHTNSNVSSLYALALRGNGLANVAHVLRVEGVAPLEEAGEPEKRWPIDEDDELEAYLGMVGPRKATFVIDLGRSSEE